MYESEQAGQFRFALTGDWLFTRPIAVFREKGFLELRDLVQGADAAFANLEAPVHRYLADAQAQRAGGGTYMTCEPKLLEDMTWFGIDLLACGSSHADDYGPDGILETIDHLDAAGITHAGSGRHLAEARAPGYLETPRGRVALLAANAQYRAGGRAGEQRRDALGYPGVNGLRRRIEHHVDEATFTELQAIGARIGGDAARSRDLVHQGTGAAAGEHYDFLGNRFVADHEIATRTFCEAEDLEENLRRVREARFFADRVVVSLHCHELGGAAALEAESRAEMTELADFAIEYGHACIDAGADVVVCHGPQLPLGVELYRGRPFFHGLGAFVFQIETIRYLPAEAYERYGLGPEATVADFTRTRYADDTRGHTAERAMWEQVLTVVDFDHDEIEEIRLYPVELGFGGPRSQRGRPLRASGEVAERILERVRALSLPYGTPFEVRDGIGVIRPAG